MFASHFDLDDGSLANAFEAASGDGPLEHRRALLSEWRDWNSTAGAVRDIRPFLEDGFSVGIRFDEPLDARNFMNRVYDSLSERVRAEAGPET